MILVTLGTQDKSFVRLLKAIDHEIDLGHIKERVVVQAGYTKYESKNMEIFDLIDPDSLENLVKDSRLIITHGGVGSILSALTKGKVVIAASRQKKYGEHTNDHQKQVVKRLAKDGYILELKDFKQLDKVLKRAEHFQPKKFKSNTDNMAKLIANYITNDSHISWYNKWYFRLLFWIIVVALIVILVIRRIKY